LPDEGVQKWAQEGALDFHSVPQFHGHFLLLIAKLQPDVVGGSVYANMDGAGFPPAAIHHYLAIDLCKTFLFNVSSVSSLNNIQFNFDD
jgi:hypothetical protein